MVIGITGHANLETPFNKEYLPEVYNPEVFDTVYKRLRSFLEEKGDITCCSGMARGVDEIFALAAIDLQLDLIICVPHSVEWHSHLPTHPKRGRAQALAYEKILAYKNLRSIIEVSGFTDNIFNKRNQAIVDQSDEIYSYHLFESIGTMDCIEKAGKKYKGNLYD